MRIIQIVEPLEGGAGRHVVDLALGLSSRGHDVHVLYSPLRLDCALERQLIADRRIVVHRIPMQRAPDPRDLTVLARTLAYLNQNGPFDVIHSHSSKAGVIGRIAATATAAAVVYTPHAFATMAIDEFTPRKRVLYRLVERTLGSVTDAVICVGEGESEHAHQVVGIPQRRIAVVPNCLNPVGFLRNADLRAELGLAPDAPLIGVVARLDNGQKGVDLAVRALGVLRETFGPRGSEVRLVVLGDGREKGSLQRLAIDCGVENAVFWLGWRPAREYFHCFHILFAPSRYEASPYTPMEALFSGVPVVATRPGGGRALIDGVNGFIVPEEDPPALAAAAKRLLGEHGLRERFSAAASRATALFSPETMVQSIENVYLRQRSAKRSAGLANAVSRWRAHARAGSEEPVSGGGSIAPRLREAERDRGH